MRRRLSRAGAEEGRAPRSGRRWGRVALVLAGVLAAATGSGCLWEPKIEDQWTRFDILTPSPESREPLPDTLSALRFQGRVTYRAIRTGSLIAEVLVSDSISYADVNFDPETPRREVLRDVERVMAGSRSLGIVGVAATGWDRLMRDVDFAILTPGGLAHGAEGGVYVVFYMGTAIREENPDGSESTRFEAFDFEQKEILPMGVELRTRHPEGVPEAAAASPGAPGAAGPGRGALSASGAPLHGRISLSAGPTLPDRHLADYQWDVTPQATGRVELGVASEAWSGGLAVQSWGTTQSVAARDDGGVAVRMTSVQPRVERRLVTAARTTLAARAGFGALRVGYAPERVTLAGGAAGAPVEVHFRPLWTWLASAGLSIDRPLSPALALGLGVERTLFPLDTTHRIGSEFLSRREYFGGWSVDGRLTWRGGAF